ncbi:MAG: hypothetical protein HY329_22740 [Chloroflexi bacterium]|nr:hypothetical protein [Chloroflexota bacterium]
MGQESQPAESEPAASLPAASSPSAGAPAAAPSAGRPTARGRQAAGPRTVTVNLSIVDFTSLSDVDATFDVIAYLAESWNDPALAQPGAPPQRRLKETETWTPKLTVLDALELKPDLDFGYWADPDGNVQHEIRFRSRHKSELSFQRFPFDSQSLFISIWSPPNSAEDLIIDPAKTTVEVLPTAQLGGWTIQGATFKVENPKGSRATGSWSELNASVTVERNTTYFTWKVFVPLLLFVTIAWSASWIDPKQIAAQNAAAIATLLTTVAFNFTVGASQPRVSYFTFYDAFNLVCFGFIAMTLLFVGFAHALETRSVGLAAAARARFAGKYLLPVYLIAGILGTALYFLVLAPRG